MDAPPPRPTCFRSRTVHLAVWASFLFCLATVLYFALVPTPPRGRLQELPRPFRGWLNAHDDFANFAVFALLGSLAFALPGTAAGEGRGSRLMTVLAEPTLRLASLLALVIALEWAQSAIPGRISDWRDVVTGLAGVGLAWWMHRWRHRRLA